MAQGIKRKNWETLKLKLEAEKKQQETTSTSSKKRRRGESHKEKLLHSSAANLAPSEEEEIVIPGDTLDSPPLSSSLSLGSNLSSDIKSKYVALDCEMVGIGSSGKKSALARCCLVDFDGNKIYDRFVRPKSYVTDFRTKWSGVRKSDLRQGVAVTLEECMADVARILSGKILVGHALSNDLDVLMLSHPRSKIRDTATYRPYMRPHGKKGGKFRPRSLRDLAKEYLRRTIQDGEHDPGIDASTAMMLYRLKRDEWEKSLRAHAKLKHQKSNSTSSANPISTPHVVENPTTTDS